VSLTKRITLLVIGLLVAGAVASGLVIYANVLRALHDDLQERLDARLLWLRTSLEMEEGRLQLGPVPEADDAAPNWEIARPGGQVLWSSRSQHLHRPVVSKSETRTMGDPNWPELSGARIEQTDPPDSHAENPGQSKGLLSFPYFALPREHRHVELVLTAWDSGAEVVAARRHIRAVIWTVIPAILAGAVLLFALVIRWQLKPLGRMAEQVAGIGPDNVFDRIAPAGTSQECVRLRDMINIMLGRLAEGLERERRFASSAAHELRTPLAQLRTHLEVSLRRERTSGEYREALGYALADVDRLQKLVQGLLQLSRAPDGGKVAGRPVPLRALLRKAEQDFGPLSLRLSAEAEGIFVSGDEELLGSAIGNVLDNASRYAPGATPEVFATLEGGRVRLTVSDRGPGVPEGERERIFAPLVRLEDARTLKDGREGFGLGLAVARSTVRSFGGDLVCRPRSDGAEGAEFAFHLQLAPAANIRGS
jgi:signal transduction histidine kinase